MGEQDLHHRSTTAIEEARQLIALSKEHRRRFEAFIWPHSKRKPLRFPPDFGSSDMTLRIEASSASSLDRSRSPLARPVFKGWPMSKD